MKYQFIHSLIHYISHPITEFLPPFRTILERFGLRTKYLRAVYLPKLWLNVHNRDGQLIIELRYIFIKLY